MGNVVKFKLRNKPTREQVVQWIKANYDTFPNQLTSHRSDPVFAGWRFIRGLDDNIYFANCIDQGISESEFKQCKKSL